MTRYAWGRNRSHGGGAHTQSNDHQHDETDKLFHLAVSSSETSEVIEAFVIGSVPAKSDLVHRIQVHETKGNKLGTVVTLLLTTLPLVDWLFWPAERICGTCRLLPPAGPWRVIKYLQGKGHKNICFYRQLASFNGHRHAARGPHSALNSF